MGATAALAGAVVAAGSGVYQAETTKSAARKQRRAQQAAQDKQASAAAAQQRRAADEASRARRPDIGTLLGGERAAARMGPASTLLTSAAGIRQQSLLLGLNSLLGG